MKNETKTSAKTPKLVLVLLALNLLATVVLAWRVLPAREAAPAAGTLRAQMTPVETYVLYIGTNDKDTYTQQIPTDEAREIVNQICVKHTGGYTESDARGGWVDETGTLTQENTLVYEFYDIGEAELTAILDEVLEALNQNSILVEHRQAVSAYYAGAGNGA